MTEQQLHVNPTIRQMEEDFYSSYKWCLNPIQKLGDLFLHLEEELKRSTMVSSDWQREECRINLYLIVCAIACTVDDYLLWRPWVFTPVGDAFPSLRPFIMLIQRLANFPYVITASARLRSVHRWRARWTACVEEICRSLLRGKNLTPAGIAMLKDELDKLGTSPLPEDLLKRRMKINEGFRCQDLTHHDILTLVDRFLESGTHPNTRIIVIGPRTAGAYFAPVVKVYLNEKGFNNVSWMTIRPKLKTTQKEYRQLQLLLTPDAHVILTDDYSNTGLTFRLLQEVLRKHGVAPDRITIFAPIHPARPDVSLALNGSTKVLTLHHNDLYKANVLDPRSVEMLFRHYLTVPGCTGVSLLEEKEVDRINTKLWDHYKDGFHVRLKRVYQVRLDYQNRESVIKRILGKSVGWGWLGYHAYIAGTGLREFVPEIIGLKNGILFTEWVEGRPGIARETAEQNISKMALYVARRTKQLALPEDPRYARPDIGWGWLEILSILRRAYGFYPGYLKHDVLLKNLKAHVSPLPTLIDGRMGPDEWIDSENGPVKVDFEHHNFGAPELDIVDPAYDLAAISFEYQLPEAGEENLLRAYREESGDQTISDRIVLYKLLYAHDAKRKTLESLQRTHPGTTREDLNRRYQWSWDFLVFTMNKLFSGMMRRTTPVDVAGRLFFLDLDGVLDAEYFGFPHTTQSGITALALLKSNNYTIIPNTGRSIQHVRNYCASYGFAGGIAEYGSVIFDALQQTEIPLIDKEVEDQLRRCREALSEFRDVYIDNGYHYAVRAYRYTSRRTVGLEKLEAEEFLKKNNLGKLSYIRRSDDTYFVGGGTSKGGGIEQFRNYFRRQEEAVIAMGDSDEDVSMLQIAGRSFAPANCSEGVRNLAKKDMCRIVPQTRQRGLLRVARILIQHDFSTIDKPIEPGVESTIGNLIFKLTGIAEQSRVKKIISLLRRDRL
jgi:hydroxymethylpyrimidine pyrophosphatase-like HAD family hydrolase